MIPIQYDANIVEVVSGTLQCSTSSFPSIYLGLPITDKKLRNRDMLAWIEKIDNKLPGWKASLLNLAGQVVVASS